MTYLTDKQVEALLRPLNPSRVRYLEKSGKRFSYLEQHDVRAHLNRVFGFARWSAVTEQAELVFETENNQRWTVAYRARVKLTINSPDGHVLADYAEWAVGSANNQPSRADAHDLAIKDAESGGLKRCATNLGDAFGLGLYDDGQLAPLVKGVLVGAKGEPVNLKDLDTDPNQPELPQGREPRRVRVAPAPALSDDDEALFDKQATP